MLELLLLHELLKNEDGIKKHYSIPKLERRYLKLLLNFLEPYALAKTGDSN